mmetsp:Transcript_36971/g.96797  ORF Transcript_36971/g.96797 Transcript_36971/m.96797 type:complete len:345 (+) Transcript_36971:43-1077(+)
MSDIPYSIRMQVESEVTGDGKMDRWKMLSKDAENRTRAQQERHYPGVGRVKPQTQSLLQRADRAMAFYKVAQDQLQESGAVPHLTIEQLVSPQSSPAKRVHSPGAGRLDDPAGRFGGSRQFVGSTLAADRSRIQTGIAIARAAAQPQSEPAPLLPFVERCPGQPPAEVPRQARSKRSKRAGSPEPTRAETEAALNLGSSASAPTLPPGRSCGSFKGATSAHLRVKDHLAAIRREEFDYQKHAKSEEFIRELEQELVRNSMIVHKGVQKHAKENMTPMVLAPDGVTKIQDPQEIFAPKSPESEKLPALPSMTIASVLPTRAQMQRRVLASAGGRELAKSRWLVQT